MAIDASAVLDAVRGVIRGELGSVRTVSTTYGEESHEATSDAERWIRGAAEVQADVQVTSGPWHSGAVGPGTASSGLWVLGLVVELSYSLAPYADLTPGTRYAARQSATKDVERLTLALTWPGNLSVDGSANATGLVSGRLSRQRHDGTALEAPQWTERADDNVGLLMIRIPFEAWIVSAQAVA